MLNAEIVKVEMDDMHQLAFPKSKREATLTFSLSNLHPCQADMSYPRPAGFKPLSSYTRIH